MRVVEVILYKTYADLKAEVARGHLGFLWWILEPVLYMGTFYLVFTAIRFQKTENFIPFLLVALVPWKWFASTVGNGSRAIMSGVNLMNQVDLPKYVFPAITIVVNFVKFLIVFLILLIFLLGYGIEPSMSWLFVPIVILVQLIMMFGVTFLLAGIVPFFPDVKQVIDNALMLAFFLSGVMFDIGQVSEPIKTYLYMNPMVTIIESYRRILVDGGEPNWTQLIILGFSSLIVLFVARVLISKFDKVYPKIVLRQ